MQHVKSLGLLALLCASPLHAQVRLSSLWADHMVLQQQTELPFWGESTPHTQVTIRPSWTQQVYYAQSDAQGHWQTHIPSGVAGGPYTIHFDDGKELLLQDVMLGEVWLCMGQSNMEISMQGNPGQPIAGAIDAISLARPERPIRMYSMEMVPAKTSQRDCPGQWLAHTPEAVAQAGATSYYFADHLERALDVPVGIVKVAWGSSSIEAWMSPAWLNQVKAVEVPPLSAPMPDQSVLRKTPFYCYHGMIAPMQHLRFKGMLWYQGEANRPNYHEYGQLLASFVHGMRAHFGFGDFPFYYAQIAPLAYPTDGKNERMREVMAQAERAIPRSGMIVLSDVGEPNCIHPSDKQTVGKRFAYMALGDAYGVKGFDYLAPRFESLEVLPASGKYPTRLGLHFERDEHGLHYFNGQSSDHLEVAGEDRVFYPAQSRIDRKGKYALEVWSKEVNHPVAVRYGFKPYFKGDLYNNYGIPLSTFRSDDW